MSRALSWLHRFEDALLALLLGSMILLAALQILLRNAFEASLSWGDPTLRALVLWVGLLGALAATRGERHITVDVVSQLVGDRLRLVFASLTQLFAGGVSAVVARAGAQFVASEREFGTIAFSGIPSWWLELVIPAAFGFMAIRFFLQAVLDAARAVRGPEEESP